MPERSSRKIRYCARCRTTEGDFWVFYGVPLCGNCASIRRYLGTRRSLTGSSFIL